jgi:hypothetical protein
MLHGINDPNGYGFLAEDGRKGSSWENGYWEGEEKSRRR